MAKRYAVYETLKVVHYVTADSEAEAKDLVQSVGVGEYDECEWSEITRVETDGEEV